MLFEFLKKHRGEVIERARSRLAKRTAPRATSEELESGIPLFLDELASRLQGATGGRQTDNAAEHGRGMLRLGFTVGQVVEDYGDICQAITELSIELGASITGAEFQTLNLALDESTADAVDAYDRGREETEAAWQTERMAAFAHELRNLIGSATIAYELLRRGDVGVAGRTGAVLGRSLAGMRDLVDRSLVAARLDSGVQRHEPVDVATFVEDAEIVASVVARARGIALSVGAVERGVVVDGDRQILAGVLTNLLQNALKFSPPGGHVSLTTRVVRGRVELEVADECGGLPADFEDTFFRPFSQRGGDRTGLGLGLSIARRGVEAHGGALHLRNIPGHGCVFTVDLPLHKKDPP